LQHVGKVVRKAGETVEHGAKTAAHGVEVAINVGSVKWILEQAVRLGIKRLAGESWLQFAQRVTKASKGTRFIVDASGRTRIFLRGGTLEVSEHAARRITERGLTLDLVEDVVTNQRSFHYFHESVWKIGYYDPERRIFVGTVENKITTVINNASQKYIQNLQAAQP
jgi:hypothetical protein